MSQKNRLCLIGLGSNQSLGQLNPTDILLSSIYALRRHNVVISKISRFYKTPAFPKGTGPDYVNAAVMVSSELEPLSLLELLHLIEKEKDRKRSKRWGRRTLDLDLLTFGNTVLPNLQTYNKWRFLPKDLQRVGAPDRLIIPHPRLQDRSFVLGPLMDIAPDWRHPVLDQSIKQMFFALDESLRNELVPL